MKKVLILLMLTGMGYGDSFADPVFVPLPEYSTPNVVVEWRNESDSTSSPVQLLTRSRRGSGKTPWTANSAGLQTVSATSAIYEGTHSERVEFRLADEASHTKDPHTLSHFDEGLDLKFVRIASNIDGFTVNLGINEEEKVMGKGCLDFSFTYKELPNSTYRKDGAVGVPFNNTILSDWSMYRFLEFYFWEDIPSHADLFIVSASQEFRDPVVRFSEDGNEIKQWHSISVDLNEALGPPEERKQIKVFAVLVGGQNIDLTRRNSFRLDEVNLWKSREIVKTRIDATPPTAPFDLRSATDEGRIHFEWKPSEDDLSGIRGYSFSFSADEAIQPATEAVIDGTEVSYPLQTLSPKSIFKIRAFNGAGMSSDTVSVKVSNTVTSVSP